MHRLFVALRPPPPIRSLLLGLQEGIASARWQDEEQLHLTLRFIGEVDRPQAEDVAAALGAVHAPVPEVRLSGVGLFDQGGRSGQLWAGVAPGEALAHLHRKVDQACVRAGLEPERRAYHPHVTVARLSRTGLLDPAVDAWRLRHAALAGPVFALTHILLYESHLTQHGARYEPVARWPLGTA